MAEWYREKIGPSFAQSNWEERTEVLTEIRLRLDSLEERERAELVKNVDLKPLFAMLTSNDKYETEQLCDAIAIFSQVAEPGYVLWKYSADIYELLSHQVNIVKVYALGEMLVATTNPTLMPELMTRIDLLLKAAAIVADGDIGVAQIAMKILKSIGEQPDGVKLLFSGPLFRAIAKALSVSDVAKFRVYDIVVHLATFSKAGLEAAINSGYLHDLIRTFDTDDILLQLNVLQTICDLASTKGGLEFLEEQGFVRKLADRIETVKDSPLDALLVPGLVMFFGHVAQQHPHQVFSKYPLVVAALDDAFLSEDQNLVRVAIDTVAHIATTLEGKYVLQEHKSLPITTIEKIGRVIQNWQTQYRVDALNALVIILSLKKSEQNDKSLKLTKSWFNLLDEKPLDKIVSLCKQPFVDLRTASLEVLAVIASQPWGQQSIAKHPGLIEFLLDRNIESFKESKQAKFQVVKNLVAAKENLLDAETMQKLKQFIREGPFHVDVATEVALEGAS